MYCQSLTQYSRLQTLEVKIGDLLLGNGHPIRVQTMTTTDTMDTIGTVEQTIRCIEAGAELVRITAPSKKEAENLAVIRKELHRRGYHTPLIADIHFTPNAAEIAARIVEKVRVNPGNYVDKKKFEFIEYTDADYREEIERIRERFTPLVRICREHGTAMRIGTNHGSLSDRIMSRYGDTPMGMVESAMEFLRIARDESFHNIILSMKSSNPQVMVQAYRLLVQTMQDEFSVCYPLHLGVTEAGDGEDGRIKSAIGIGTLLEDGIGDTIRVSLTEDPEFEIPVCRDIVKRYNDRRTGDTGIPAVDRMTYDPFNYRRRVTDSVMNIGSGQVPVVVADLREKAAITAASLDAIGYRYDEGTDKWNISDGAADYVYTGNKILDFAMPGTLRVLVDKQTWLQAPDKEKYIPLFDWASWNEGLERSTYANFLAVDVSAAEQWDAVCSLLASDKRWVAVLESSKQPSMAFVRRFIIGMQERGLNNPLILKVHSKDATVDEQLIHFSTEAGALLLDGMGDGIWLTNTGSQLNGQIKVSGRTYLEVKNNSQFLNNTSFSILQATRTRISKTEYISCPSCGRTLFDLQETTALIRSHTHHLKGVKIAIMGCIVNGPGEMADADFGYVGSGPGKITLYKGKEIVKRNIDSEIALQELIGLLKENDAWTEPNPEYMQADYLVIGSGIAGLTFALKISQEQPDRSIILMTKSQTDETNTKYAQGGIAAVWDEGQDHFDKHIEDTLVAGDGLCNEEVVKLVVQEGPQRVKEIIEWGARFDRSADGEYALGKEGGHSEHRILHYKDITGREMERALLDAVRKRPNIQVISHCFVVDLITQHHLGYLVTKSTPGITCFGVYALNLETKHIEKILARLTVLATGGNGQIYRTTTNPAIATGDGVAMVYRAKGRIENMEFIQFHPTALYEPGLKGQAFLITEAVRGDGGVLRNRSGEAFMSRYDDRKDLAPRDIVARAIDNEMKIGGTEHVWLDCRHMDPVRFVEHFPNIHEKCLSIGIDFRKDWIPVAPAAHYSCGGIKTDLQARTSIHRLYAVGECASTGLHGANRLASNSLLEAMVFAHRAFRDAADRIGEVSMQEGIPDWSEAGTTAPREMILITQSLKELQLLMTDYVGIVRSNVRLERASRRLDLLHEETEELYRQTVLSPQLCELRNMITVSYLVVKGAGFRQESRGLHYNTDHPMKSDLIQNIVL